ncbi:MULTISPECIES: amylo-alpha-1,6-glucosidase [Protofrankia]|uniref:Glycoside hydrolase n=1 Tax=Protofrankia coriariae TaxID=1562887 RepID=A0ABR5F8A2_9ACTN|nr:MULTISPECIES: glycoside hydrolase [Protofrankia]KLL12898.1 glycoside hydrolase [Protofrankia coriariae]ONH36505.1 glycoside hydrolase [Protofrankia sp. BMG5.30]
MSSSALPSEVLTELRTSAIEVLRDNDLGGATRPSPTLYPHQWLWDSCFIAIGLRHIDPERASREILSLLHGQWPNGMIPHVIFSGSGSYHAGPDRWRSDLVDGGPEHVQTTGVTQPPMIAEAVVRVGEVFDPARRREFYRAIYPGLLRYHCWLYRERDPDDTGLVTLVHSWESGMDNTPAWMELTRRAAPIPLKLIRRLNGDGALDALRRDNKEVPSDQRLSATDLFTLYHLVGELRDARYDFSRIRASRVPLVQDVAFNAILARANDHLRDIAADIGEQLPNQLLRSARRTRAALPTLFADGMYWSRDARSGRLISRPTVAGFLALYAGVVPPDSVEDLVSRMTARRFWPAHGIASTPTDDPDFQPRCYWQGPVWVNMNWLLADGLDRAGRGDLAERLRAGTISMIAGSEGLYEYYSPFDGTGVGSNHFSWTAALLLDLLDGRKAAHHLPSARTGADDGEHLTRRGG